MEPTGGSSDFDFFTPPPAGAGGTSTTPPAGAFDSGAPFVPGTGPSPGLDPRRRPRNRRSAWVRRSVLLGVLAVVVVAGFVVVPKLHLPERLAYYRASTQVPDTIAIPDSDAKYVLVDPSEVGGEGPKPTLGAGTKQAKTGAYQVDGRDGLALYVGAAKLEHPHVDGTGPDLARMIAVAEKVSTDRYGEPKTIPSGSLGGVVECATGTSMGSTARICGSIDAGVKTLMFFQSARTSDATVLAVREAFEKKL